MHTKPESCSENSVILIIAHGKYFITNHIPAPLPLIEQSDSTINLHLDKCLEEIKGLEH